MNVSHKLKLIWFAPPRTASRALHGILRHYDFVNLVEGEHADLRTHPHTHECKIPVGLEHYDVLLQVRNPYSKIVSLWHLDNANRASGPFNPVGKKCDSLNEFIYNNLRLHVQRGRFENLPVFTPKYLVRYENLIEDVRKLNFINFEDKIINLEYSRLILNNSFLHEREYSITKALDDRHADWQQHYTQELADVVYYAAEQHFTKFKYDRESWKRA